MAKIEVKVVPKGMKTEVTGYVDGKEVIVLGNGMDGMWGVDMSSCLPTNHKRAAAVVECMRQTFLRAAEYGAPKFDPAGGDATAGG